MLVLATASLLLASDQYPKNERYTVGEVISTDARTHKFTIKYGNEESTFRVDSATKYQGLEGFSDLKPGVAVQVYYTENDRENHATRIEALGNPCKRYPDLPQCHKQGY